MGTFILTFVGRSLTMALQQNARLGSILESPSKRRKLLVLAYFITIALILTVFGVLTIPYIVREGADFIGRLQAENIWCVRRQPNVSNTCDMLHSKLITLCIDQDSPCGQFYPTT
jgi:predicted PurR-regulated permease PerM